MFIGQCLSSIVGNEVDKTLYEVIVIDDGSTDASAQIVREFCVKYPNILLYTQTNQGVSVARMKGISKAEGDYIWFIDSDDWIDKDALLQIFEELNKDVAPEVIIAPFRLRFQDRQPIIAPVITNSCVACGKTLLRTKQYSFIGPPYFVFKRSFFQNPWLYFPRNTRFEDEYFARVLLYQADKILLLNHPYYNYRQQADSFMHSCSINSAPYFIEVYKHLKDFADSQVKEEDKDWFSYNITSFLLESIVRNLNQVHSDKYTTFKKNSLPFIRQEFFKNRRCFPLKEQVLGGFLLSSPLLYAYFLNKHNAKKISRQ